MSEDRSREDRPPPHSPGDEYWERFLSAGGDSWQAVGRRLFKRIPADPRCRMCAAPFRGPGGGLMKLIGKRQSDANPNWCTSCSNTISRYHGGAEVDGAMLFADIRGSTSLAEGMSPSEFHDLLDRFLSTATAVVFRHDGAVDKFVGDELVAYFFPLLAGERYTARAVDAGTDLLRATGHDDPAGPWVPVGVGVHSGRAWFGAVGEGRHVELTVVGDAVNVAARLASVAHAGELLVSADAAAASDLDSTLERRVLGLKGKERPIEVVSVRIGQGS